MTFAPQVMAMAIVSAVALAMAGCGGGGDGGDNAPPALATVVPPMPLPGPYSVACSNVAQDFERVPPGDAVDSYWKGSRSTSGTPRYLTDLLADPANTLSVTITVPDDTTLYGSFAGSRVAYVLLACYPTVANNPRPGYPLPTGVVVPHMQTGMDAPLFTDAAARYPLLAFSHGYRGSPLGGDYMTAMSIFASYGYLVVAPFHGDGRVADLNVDELGDVVTVISQLRDFVALQALRPLSMSAAIDLMLAHPQWKDHVNAAQIGGFGASMGGETMMLMGGAGLTTSVEMAWTRKPVDPRLKAAVGYVPYFGAPLLPAFGRNQHGLDGITLPYLAIAGTADVTAPLLMTEQGMRRLGGTRELVALAGLKHEFDIASSDDIFTWALTFLEAEVRGTASARQQLAAMASVSGGADDRVVIPYNGLVPR